MKRAAKLDPKALTREEVEYYYSLLQEEVTEYNCGSLCAPANGGIPVCCQADNALPTLYKSEYEMLSERTDLWKEYVPGTKEEKKEFAEYDQRKITFCECKGVAHCERENRSISCRTFPLEPYLDTRGVIVGLVFMKEFTSKCPLTSREKDIRQEFIDNHFLFWEKLLFRLESEYEVYWDSSKAYRRWRKRTGNDFPILYPSHLKGKEYLKQYI
ncbi:hypothetical protein LEP1GSC047_2057 [Leptospira inadai serovar Lyme str. 10]|uniref:Uncharacterized protein n=2 Tax=Leptospira inadai serovar Lyme TaxID=293084 RepID=V6HFB8_9LEPT|nr:hypothetical protein [Leptospira inadai]EQA38293.1 hypothetical protein LEP1GSC047_2057 [Leptospira inadai serovar Lyme str. 10]PNV74447.1 hypothetical protein BES34_013890 [Leptospira inadai serovar Lyme]